MCFEAVVGDKSNARDVGCSVYSCAGGFECVNATGIRGIRRYIGGYGRGGV